MDRANKLSSSSSSSSPPSSFAVDLFGPKDSSSKSPNSSAGFFGSIFGPQSSMVPGTPQDYANAYGNAQHETTTDYKNVKGNPNSMEKEMNSSYDNGRSVDPCYYNSSIYYGGQEIYSPSNRNTPPQNFKKDGGNVNVDQNEGNSSGASRGNWWQGSLYY